MLLYSFVLSLISFVCFEKKKAEQMTFVRLAELLDAFNILLSEATYGSRP
jgi:hypothetical protein